MRIYVASQNQRKMDAVEKAFYDFGGFDPIGLNFVPVTVPSGVPDDPNGLETLFAGAHNRALGAFDALKKGDCDYSVGVENGSIDVPWIVGSKKLYLCACCIYDGQKTHIGLSPAFELPEKVARVIEVDKVGLNEACFRAGMTQDRKLGYSQGLLGLLTQGKFRREDAMYQSVVAALIHLKHP